jgi:hypothetical protein
VYERSSTAATSRREEVKLEDLTYRARWIFDPEVQAPGMAIAHSAGCRTRCNQQPMSVRPIAVRRQDGMGTIQAA